MRSPAPDTRCPANQQGRCQLQCPDCGRCADLDGPRRGEGYHTPNCPRGRATRPINEEATAE